MTAQNIVKAAPPNPYNSHGGFCKGLACASLPLSSFADFKNSRTKRKHNKIYK